MAQKSYFSTLFFNTNMKKFVYLFLFFSAFTVFSQNEQLAQNYYERGEFEKAELSYDELFKSNPNNTVYFQRLVDCYQQLLKFDKAEKTIQERMDRFKQSYLLVELGYNFQLQKNQAKADKLYDEAIASIDVNISNVYSVANTFEKKVLIERALISYEKAVKKDSNLQFNYQMAMLYGQQGKQDLMIEKFLDEVYLNPQSQVVVQNQLTRFMSEDSEETFNLLLKKSLLLRAQKNQDIFWNQFLSWFYVQQKDYGKAFIQEKAIYKRNPETFSNIVNLGQLAIEENEDDIAKEILTFVLENTNDLELLIQAHYFLTDLKINKAAEKDYSKIHDEIELLLKEFGISPYTISLQTLQAHFTTFNLKNPERGKEILRNALDLPLNKYQSADVKMELADILLYEEKFNQALIYYAQIEEDLKNDVIGHEASLKVAKTSYFKTDFEWAMTQLKVLKSSSTQLIANDALELFLLLNDNTIADSTQVALKEFAKGDFLLYQKRDNEALVQFQKILKENKEKEIEDETLLRIGMTYEKLGDYANALTNYQIILDQFKESIYTDEALFFSAELYNKKLNLPEKAKEFYEKVIFNHQDSIYFVEARKKYRLLRGDTTL